MAVAAGATSSAIACMPLLGVCAAHLADVSAEGPASICVLCWSQQGAWGTGTDMQVPAVCFLQGEMGATVFFYPWSWAQAAEMVRGRACTAPVPDLAPRPVPPSRKTCWMLPLGNSIATAPPSMTPPGWPLSALLPTRRCAIASPATGLTCAPACCWAWASTTASCGAAAGQDSAGSPVGRPGGAVGHAYDGQKCHDLPHPARQAACSVRCGSAKAPCSTVCPRFLLPIHMPPAAAACS